MLISSFLYGNFEISIYDSIQSVISEKWDSFNGGNLQSDYLTLIEISKPIDLQFRYIFVEEINIEKKRLCAVFYLQLLQLDDKNISFNNSFILNFFSSLIFKLRSFQILICGNLFAVNFPAIKYNPDLINKTELIKIISEVDKLQKSDVIIIKDLEEFSQEDMPDNNWKPYTSDLTMALEINSDWKNLDGYVKVLTKKYRKRAKKIIDSGKIMIRKKLNEQEIKLQLSQLDKLFKQVVDKQPIRMGLLGANYFHEFMNRFPERFTFYGYYFKDKLVAFASYIDHESALELHYIGIDYSYNEELMIYFNILFDGIEKAIEMKKNILELGRTAREAKANLGSKPVYFNDYVLINNRLANLISKILGQNFNNVMGQKWMNKHPFK